MNIQNNQPIQNQITYEVKHQLPHYKNLQQFDINITMLILAEIESSFNPTAERQEPQLNTKSVGLFQILLTTLDGLGYDNTKEDINEIPTQVKYALKYIDYLYNRLGEIHNPEKRMQVTLMAYNCGIGNINKAIRVLLYEEDIAFEGVDTKQGKWTEPARIWLTLKQSAIVSATNARIVERYLYIPVKLKESYICDNEEAKLNVKEDEATSNTSEKEDISEKSLLLNILNYVKSKDGFFYKIIEKIVNFILGNMKEDK